MIVLKSTTETQAFDFIPREYVPSLDPIYKVSIFSEIQNKEIILKISHNGQGITNQEFEVFANNSNGLGLNSMQSRVIILNGKLYFSKNENSAEIKLITPYNNYETN